MKKPMEPNQNEPPATRNENSAGATLGPTAGAGSWRSYPDPCGRQVSGGAQMDTGGLDQRNGNPERGSLLADMATGSRGVGFNSGSLLADMATGSRGVGFSSGSLQTDMATGSRDVCCSGVPLRAEATSGFSGAGCSGVPLRAEAASGLGGVGCSGRASGDIGGDAMTQPQVPPLCTLLARGVGRFPEMVKGEVGDLETKSVKSVTWEVAEKMEKVWNFSEQRSGPPSVDLLEGVSVTESRVSADLLRPEYLSEVGEKMSVDLLSAPGGSEVSGAPSVDLLHPVLLSESGKCQLIFWDLPKPVHNLSRKVWIYCTLSCWQGCLTK